MGLKIEDDLPKVKWAEYARLKNKIDPREVVPALPNKYFPIVVRAASRDELDDIPRDLYTVTVLATVKRPDLEEALVIALTRIDECQDSFKSLLLETLGTGECFIERYCLLFQKISPTVPLQYLHLLDCNLVELYQAFALRHTVAKEFHRVSIAKPIGHKEIAIFGFQHICNADVILTVYIRDCYLRVLDCYLCHIAFSYSRPTWGILCTKIRRIIESKTFLNENLHKTAQNRLIVNIKSQLFQE